MIVLGGSGFVGSAFRRLYPDHHFNFRNEYIATGDVLYLISTTHNYNVFDNPHLDIDTNLNTLVDALEQWRRYGNPRTFNFVSSWFVYGPQIEPLLVPEDAPCNPQGFYSITKRAAEQLLISYCGTFGLDYRILRLGNVIGRGDKKAGPKRNAIQYMVSQLAAGQPVKIYGDGSQLRSFIHVEDAARAIELITRIGLKNCIYNVGTGCDTWDFKRIIEFCAREIHSPSRITYSPPPEFHKQVQVESFTMDVSRLDGLGFVPKYTGEDLFRELIPNPIVPGTVNA